MELTFFAYLIASIVAIGYACLRGLTPIRRIAVAALALVLEVCAGALLVVPHSPAAYAVGFPTALALGLIMTAPRDRPRKPEPADATDVKIRRAPRNGAPLPVITDPWAALYASMAGDYRLPAAPANRNRRRTDPGFRRVVKHPTTASAAAAYARRAADQRLGGGGERVAARARRRTGSPSLRRATRCPRH